METRERIDPETLRAFLEGLPDLLESLRAEGYGLGPRQHVAAYELVGSLFARGCLPPTLVGLDEWLAPLVCFTPAHQEDFRERYLQWLVERRFVNPEDVRTDPAPIVPPPPPPAPKTSVRAKFVRFVSTRRRPLAAAGAAIVAAAALFAAYYFGPAYRNEEDPAQVVRIDPPPPAPTPVPIREDIPATPTPTPPPAATPAPDAGLAWDADKPAEAAASPTPPPPPPLPPPNFWARNFGTIVALTLLTPFAALGLWQVLRRRRRQREAERWQGERPRYDKIKVRGARERVFQSAALRPVARGLRHYLSVESRQLDARRTVYASVGRGGLFTPVYGRRRALPEYLVLIDRVGFGDQLAQFYSDLSARLAERDVYIDTYYFHGDPRRCREGGPDSPQLSLSDLVARHPDHYLLIFSDGTGFLSTTTGRPEPFVEQLLFWRGRALLTPVPRLEWEYREWALEREGLKVLPATLDGLRLLVDVVNAGERSLRVPDFDETPPYPDILREQPSLWKERDEPPAPQTRRLLTHLRRYLGPKGFELLCACAVYPVMQWGVTLFLAYELLGRREVEELLPRLLRLPWFRNGTMPQWLRRTLVKELPRARRRVVRERLEHLLLDFLEDPERGVRPRFAEESAAQEDASLTTRLSERLAAWRRSRRLRRRLEQAPARSPLAESVFLNYITNNQRAESLPEPVRNRLFPRGVAAFGLRLAPAAALVAVAVLTSLSLLLLARPTEDIASTQIADLCALLCPRPSANTTDPDFTYTPTTAQRGQTVEVKIWAVAPGTYDLRNMWVSAFGLTDTPLNSDPDLLTVSFTVPGDATLGPTALNLFEGNATRAMLPFTVTAAGMPAPIPTPTPRVVATPVGTGPCPNLTIQDMNVATRAPDVYTLSVLISGRQGSAPVTYRWSAAGGASILSGLGEPTVRVRFPNNVQSGMSVSVVASGEGFFANCSNSAAYAFGPTSEHAPTPVLGVSVNPSTVTVCPNNPKQNDPQDSTVDVFASFNQPALGRSLDAEVSAGKLIRNGFSRANLPILKWDLSGLPPGTYTVTAYGNPGNGQDGLPRQNATAKVTVKGCPDSGSDISDAVLSAAARATKDIVVQVNAMESLSRDMARRKQLTDAEALAVNGAATRLGSALNSLGRIIDASSAIPRVNSPQAFAAPVNAVYAALKDLEGQIAKVHDPMAQAELSQLLNAMQKNSSLLNPLKGPSGN